MPEQRLPKRASTKRASSKRTSSPRRGRSASSEAGEYVRKEITDIRKGKHGARSAKQAIAIGLSKARRAGVELKPPAPGKTSEKTRQAAERAYELGHGAPPKRTATARRRKASRDALKREPTDTVSRSELSRQAKEAASKKSPAERSRAAKKAVETKGRSGRKRAAAKAARTRARKG